MNSKVGFAGSLALTISRKMTRPLLNCRGRDSISDPLACAETAVKKITRSKAKMHKLFIIPPRINDYFDLMSLAIQTAILPPRRKTVRLRFWRQSGSPDLGHFPPTPDPLP